MAIHQPNYIPYPGFFAKLYLSDVFVIYDIAQFTRGDFINRNRIRTFSKNGYMWLTLPVGKQNFKGIQIKDVKIKDEQVFGKHHKTLHAMYSKAPFFDVEICEVINTPHRHLAEHNLYIIEFLRKKLRINHTKIVLSSELNVTIRQGTQGLIDIVRAVKGDEYISGVGARSYLQYDEFQKEKIKLSISDFQPWIYKQMHPGFVENMSIIDAIFNIGWENATLKLKQTKVSRIVG
ncbi:MAG: WbqC family protein [Nitrososphaeria archaeon]